MFASASRQWSSGTCVFVGAPKIEDSKLIKCVINDEELYADGSLGLDEMELFNGHALNEWATEVEASLLALRGRVDELLAFVQAGGEPSAASTGAVPSEPSTCASHAPIWAVPSPRRR